MTDRVRCVIKRRGGRRVSNSAVVRRVTCRPPRRTQGAMSAPPVPMGQRSRMHHRTMLKGEAKATKSDVYCPQAQAFCERSSGVPPRAYGLVPDPRAGGVNQRVRPSRQYPNGNVGSLLPGCRWAAAARLLWLAAAALGDDWSFRCPASRKWVARARSLCPRPRIRKSGLRLVGLYTWYTTTSR